MMSEYEYVYTPVLNCIETALRHEDGASKEAAVITIMKFFSKELISDNHAHINEMAKQFDEDLLRNEKSPNYEGYTSL